MTEKVVCGPVIMIKSKDPVVTDAENEQLKVLQWLEDKCEDVELRASVHETQDGNKYPKFALVEE